MHDTHSYILHLMPYHRIFIIRTVVRTLPLTAGQETIHIILVQIYKTTVAFIIFIIYIIRTAVTACFRHNRIIPFTRLFLQTLLPRQAQNPLSVPRFARWSAIRRFRKREPYRLPVPVLLNTLPDRKPILCPALPHLH